MAALRFVEDFDSAQDLYNELKDHRGGILVLMTRAELKAGGLTEEQAEERIDDYTCGDDPDVYLDIASFPGHYFFATDQDNGM